METADVLGLLLCLYIHMFNVLYYYLFHDLIVNFLIPLYVNTFLVYSYLLLILVVWALSLLSCLLVAHLS